MTISADQALFRRALALAASATKKGGGYYTKIPILAAVHVRANGALEFTGTDLDMALTTRIERGGDSVANFMLSDPKAIGRALAAAGGQEVTFAADIDRATLSAGGVEITLKHQLPVDDFPGGLAVTDQRFSATLGADHLRQIARIQSAISKEETRYYLNGIYIHKVADWTYRAVATDGHRLMTVDLALPDADGDLPETGMILPRDTLARLFAVAGKCPEGVTMAVGSKAAPNRDETLAPDPRYLPVVRFASKVDGIEWSLTSKTIDGKYPDYARVVPAEPKHSAIFEAAELRRAVAALSSFGTGIFRCGIKFEFSAGIVRLSADWPDLGGSGRIELPCSHDAPSGSGFGLNGHYVLDMLAASGGEEIAFGMDGAVNGKISEGGPILIQNPADPIWTGVQMPMRV